MSARQVASIVSRAIKSFLKVQNVISVQKRRRPFTNISWWIEKASDLVLVMLKNTILKTDFDLL